MNNKFAKMLACGLIVGATAAGAADTPGPADFAHGNMAEAVKAMDANGDGMISNAEYMAYESARYDKSVEVPTGNMSDAVKAERSSKRESHLKQRSASFDAYAKKSSGLVPAQEMVGYLRGAANAP